MSLLKNCFGMLMGLISLLPVYAQPGLFGALVLLLLWLLARRGRMLWNWVIRSLAMLVAIMLALALYPEYIHTQARRRSQREPSAVAIATTPLANRILDLATDTRQSHQKPTMPRLGPPPVNWALVVWVLPMVVYFLARQEGGETFVPIWQAILTHWTSMQTWMAS